MSGEIGEVRNVPVAENDSITPDLASRVGRDFFLSFKFSQGSVDLQEKFFIALLRHYRQTEDIDSLVQLRDDPSFIRRLRQLRAPRGHVLVGKQNPHPMTAQEEANGFTKEADIFIPMLGGRSQIGEEVLEEICASMINRDLELSMRNDFQRKHQATDPKASYFRDFILARQSTTSEAFDTIFADVSEIGWRIQPDSYMSMSIFKLAGEWDYRHPGESFYPPYVAPET